MRKLLYIILPAILALCANCQGRTDKTDASAYDSSAFHIALLPIDECQPFLLAESAGLYDSLGISVQIHNYEAAMDVDTALMNGFVQMGICDSVKMISLQEKCDTIDTLVCVMKDHLSLSLIMSEQITAKNLKKLKEKVVALTRNSSLDYFADKITEKAKLTHEELNRPQINNIRLRRQMQGQAQYDGCILPEPWATECLDSMNFRVITSDQLCPLQFYAVVKKSTQGKHKQEISKVLEAYRIAKERIELQRKENRDD